jgi:hypothetical protein
MANTVKQPGPRWYSAMNMLQAKKYMKAIAFELQSRNDLKIKLGDKFSSFINWAGWERLNYEANLDEEVEDFLKKKFASRKRMYHTNVDHWKVITKRIFERDKYTCQYCDQVGGILECDHIIPFSEGGSDEDNNLTTACRKCNRRKKNKSVAEFNDWLNKLLSNGKN